MPGGTRLTAWSMRRPRLARLPIGFGWLTHRGLTPDQAERSSRPLLSNAGVRADTSAVLRGIDARLTLAAAERLPGVDVPVLLAWSDDDRAFARRPAERLAAAIPRAGLVTVPDSAAFSALDHPAALAGLVLGFLAETAARGETGT